jgi:hypothetical protein
LNGIQGINIRPHVFNGQLLVDLVGQINHISEDQGHTDDKQQADGQYGVFVENSQQSGKQSRPPFASQNISRLFLSSFNDYACIS